ncbi:hypothetical protein AJ88_01140 [Mesorhizobium amorphae CCBAU 01583]|nr:hypothetical protein AJ88_01140 [Mesorhizobium amorphae CCBAU 01583]
MRQTAFVARSGYMGEGLRRRVDPVAAGQGAACLGQCRDHQAVPVGQRLAVATRPDALFPGGEQYLLERGQLVVVGDV